MMMLLLFLALLHVVLGNCPSGFELARAGQCRGKYQEFRDNFDKMAVTAQEKCKEIQGIPVIIHDEMDQHYWMEHEDRNELNTLIIALTCNTSNHKWEWIDGSHMDYKPPTGKYDEELDWPCEEHESWYLPQTLDGWVFWWDFGVYEESNSDYTFSMDIFCSITLPPQPTPDDCDYWGEDGQDGVCYQIGEAAESWKDAQMNCKKLGYTLASVHTTQENGFIRRMAASKKANNGVYIGATPATDEGRYRWIDGSAWDFDYFSAGYPKAGLGDCVVMDTSTTSGQWINTNCSTKLPVACVREKNVADEACSAETWKEGSIITSPGFPFTSSIPCEYYLEVEAGKRVELEVGFLEANTCCDYLVIYDGYMGGFLLGNISGEVHTSQKFTTTTSNTMRVTWAPNGGVNVRGLMMTFRGV